MPHTEEGCGIVLSNGRFAVLSTRRFDSFNFDEQTWKSLSDTSVLDLEGGSPYEGSLVVRVSPHIILVVATKQVMIITCLVACIALASHLIVSLYFSLSYVTSIV